MGRNKSPLQVRGTARPFLYYIDKALSVFAFHDLRYLSLDAPSMPDGLKSDYPERIASLLRVCPKLEVLSIRLSAPNVSGSSWSLNAVCAALEGITFPHLHTLHAHGELREDWDGFFNLPDMGSLRAFLVRHRSLRTVTFGATYGYRSRDCVPENVEELLPFLRHFEAVSSLCEAVMNSQLATQIQSLRITNIGAAQMHLVPYALQHMPALRDLSVRDGYGSGSGRSVADKDLLVYHPLLEELELEPEIRDIVRTSLVYLANTILTATCLTLGRVSWRIGALTESACPKHPARSAMGG
ncbi:hypothetical protein FRC07_009165, partial [Ceratobasidium sp. 392]